MQRTPPSSTGLMISLAHDRIASSIPVSPEAPVEYIVVGSGAGGGPLAVNLAKAGHKLVLFEAGGDDGEVNAHQIFKSMKLAP